MRPASDFYRSARRSVTYAAGGSRSRTTPRRFVIYTVGRSGSELLVELLDAHPRVVCEGEVLRTPARYPTQLLRGRAVLAARGGAQVFGAKLLFWHMQQHADRLGSHESFLGELAAEQVQIIRLRRRNLAMHAISLAHAMQSRFHWRSNEQARFEPIHVDPSVMWEHLMRLEADDAASANAVASLPHVLLTYEDDLASSAMQEATTTRLFERFGVSACPVESSLVRVTPRTIRDRVVNFDELADALTGSPYASMLAEPS